MAVLIRGAVIALLAVGCYTPEYRDCTVTCAAADDCADGQLCAGGWCVAESSPRCGASADASTDPDHDAGDPEPDAAEPDPDAEDDTVALHVGVDHKGKIRVEPLGVECSNPGGNIETCTFAVPLGSEQTLIPVITHHDFKEWVTDNCHDFTDECVITIDASEVTVVGKFD